MRSCQTEKKHWHFGYSNPNFEYFMLLHFNYSTKSFSSKELEKCIKELSGLKNPKSERALKGSKFLTDLISNWDTGRKNACAIQKYQSSANSVFPNDNPNTTLGELLLISSI